MARVLNPFSDFDRFFSDLARNSDAVAMPMDVYREGDKFIAEIDLPGVDPATIDVDVEERTLTIRAERKPSEDEEGREWFTRGRPTGVFSRQLTLGRRVALDRVEAQYSDGVIRLVVPVAEESKSRKIEVTHVDRSTSIADSVEGPREVEAGKATEKS